MWDNHRNQLIGSVVLSTAFGAIAGYVVAAKRLEAKYEKLLETEIEQTKQFYSRLNKTDEYSTPESTASALIGDAVDALRSYQGDEDDKSGEGESVTEEAPETDDEDEVIPRNVFVDRKASTQILNIADRNTEFPYVITMDEYMENPNDHDQISLTYFEGDDVLADERDKPLEDVNGIVGKDNLNFGFGSEDPNVVLVRNDQVQLDFEILKSEGKFAHEVLGFDQDELQHSDSMRRRRRSWDDDE